MTVRQLEGLTEEQICTALSGCEEIELDDGCSIACPDCGACAKLKVKTSDYIRYDELSYILEYYHSYFIDEVLPYFNSDPLDYQDGDKNIIDVCRLFDSYGMKYFVSTGYPKNRRELFLQALDLGYIHRLSITNHNALRLIEDSIIYYSSLTGFGSNHPKLAEVLEKERTYVGTSDWRRLLGRKYNKDTEYGISDLGGLDADGNTILRSDGIYNKALCIPTEDYKTGLVVTKINHSFLGKMIPTTGKIEDILKYGIVTHIDRTYLYHGDENPVIWLMLKNYYYHSNGTTYYVFYDAVTTEVFYIVRDDKSIEFDYYIHILKNLSLINELNKKLEDKYLSLRKAAQYLFDCIVTGDYDDKSWFTILSMEQNSKYFQKSIMLLSKIKYLSRCLSIIKNHNREKDTYYDSLCNENYEVLVRILFFTTLNRRM